MIGLVTKNLPWKLLSLGLAVLLWFALVGEPEMATSVTATVQYRNLPEDLEISSDLTDYVHLEVRGPSDKLTHTSLVNTAVILDLSNVKRPGERTFTIGRDNTTLPMGVNLSRAVPAQVRLKMERRLARDVPVRVRYTGMPPRGFHLSRQEVTPPRLRIVGPESRVSQVEAVQTDPIDLALSAEQNTFLVSSYVGDPHIRFENSSQVTVRIALEPSR